MLVEADGASSASSWMPLCKLPSCCWPTQYSVKGSNAGTHCNLMLRMQPPAHGLNFVHFLH